MRIDVEVKEKKPRINTDTFFSREDTRRDTKERKEETEKRRRQWSARRTAHIAKCRVFLVE